MEGTPRLYNTLFSLLGQHSSWKDVRHLHTLTWMIVALIQSKTVSLPTWAPFVKSRAVFAQSVVRRFTHWLRNDRIHVRTLWAPIIRFALKSWEHHTLYLALDTTLLWEQFCQIRLSVIYRGRAIPLVWKTLKQKSSGVAFETYKEMLDAATDLLPPTAEIVLLVLILVVDIP